MIVINPYEIASAYLALINIDFEEVANGQGGIQQEQLSLLTSAAFIAPALAKNARITIKRLEKSANKKNIDMAANVENTLTGTLASAITDEIEAEFEDEDPMVRWMPSVSDEIDILHATNYAKVMKLSTALGKGLGRRYGCKCSFQFINDTNTDRIEEKFTINNTNLVEQTQ